MENLLPDWITSDLARSGISADVAAVAGIRHVTADECRAILGFGVPDGTEGYSIPFLDPASAAPMKGKHGRDFVRVRFRQPIRLGDRDVKYASARGAGNRAYIPVSAYEASSRGESICITEGEKKSLSATIHGIPTIGLIGAFGFLDGDTKDLLGDLHPYVSTGRDVTFVLDSDAAVNHDLALAAYRFSACARLRGCSLKVLVLPPRLIPTERAQV